MKSALIVGSQPLYRMAIAGLLKPHGFTEIEEAMECQPGESPELAGFDLLIICVDPGDQRMVEQLNRHKRLCPGGIVLFTQVLGRRHKSLLQRRKVDLCVPLSVPCDEAAALLSRLIALQQGANRAPGFNHGALTQCFLPDLSDLSSSEQVVLHHLRHGLSNRAIAERMGLKLNTVKVHLARACRKAGFVNRTQAAMICRQLQEYCV